MSPQHHASQPAVPERSPAELAELLDPERCAPEALECLELAATMAQRTRSVEISAAHIALAYLKSDNGVLDRHLAELFAGLRADTVADSLFEILELAAEQEDREAPEIAGELLSSRWFSHDGLELLSRARTLAADGRAGRLTRPALGSALFASPESFLAEAFEDAGVSVSELESLAQRLAAALERPHPNARPDPVFVADALVPERFGAVTRKALAELARIARAEASRKLRDVDLLRCLVRQDASRLAQALHLIGAPAAGFRRHLETVAGTPGPADAPPPLRSDRMSRFLRRIFEEAAALALRDRSPVVTESHLVRAHLDRVAGAGGNLYERHGVDTLRLRNHLEKYFTEPELAAFPSAAQRPDVATILRSRVLHQEHAIRCVVPALKRMRSGLGEPGRVLGTFLFLGPTGVGKTELARAMAEAAFGTGDDSGAPPLSKIDCGKLTDQHDVVQLIGARQGLVGYKEGQLTNALRDRPESVILFDEAEKAHPQVWQSLLPLFQEGTLQEADGTEHDATRCIIVATSNKGYQEAIERYDPFSVSEAKDRNFIWEQVEQDVESALRSYFSAEFFSRFGRENIVFFRHFTEADYAELVRLRVDELIAEMAARGLRIDLDDSVIAFLGAQAFRRREEGARPVRRLITRHLRDQIVDAREADPNRTDFHFSALAGNERVVLKRV